MPLTLEETEKALQTQASEIKALKDSLGAPMPAGKLSEIEKMISDLAKRFDELHTNYAKLTEKDTEEVHHCFWCK